MFLGGDQFNGEDGGLSLWEMPESVRDRKIEWVHLSPEHMEGVQWSGSSVPPACSHAVQA